MDTPYAKFYAEKIFERIGIRKVGIMRFEELTGLVAVELEAFQPQAHEIVAIASAVQKLARDMAPPADSPRARGESRMYR